MKNEKHFVSVEIPELDFAKYRNLFIVFSQVRGNLTKADERSFTELAELFENAID